MTQLKAKISTKQSGGSRKQWWSLSAAILLLAVLLVAWQALTHQRLSGQPTA